MMKNNQKKCHLKNDKVEHVLLYHFLNDENHTQIVSPGRKNLFDRICYDINEWKQILLYL